MPEISHREGRGIGRTLENVASVMDRGVAVRADDGDGAANSELEGVEARAVAGAKL